MILRNILLFVMIFILEVSGQSNADYFPWETGDMWEYTLYYLPDLDTLQTIVIDDSTDEAGNIYTTHFSRAINPIRPPYTLLIDTLIYKIDSNLYVYHRYFDFNNEQWINVYRLNGNAGDKWIMWDYSHTGDGPFEMARINFITDTLLFGIESKLMEIIYFFTNDSTDTTGLVRKHEQLLKGIGLYIMIAAELDAQIYLQGAVIDGILYGDTTVVNVEDDYATVIHFELKQNYPNPFNPSTTIKYEIPERCSVSIKVYDVLGNEVAMLVNEDKQAGAYEVEFDGSALTSGIYFYQLKAGEFVATKKMILLK